MKRHIIILLCIPALCTTCLNDDWIDPVEGEWTHKAENGDIETRYFTSIQDQFSYSIVERPDGTKIRYDFGTYTQDHYSMYFEREQRLDYQIIADSLWLTDTADNRTKKYIRKRHAVLID